MTGKNSRTKPADGFRGRNASRLFSPPIFILAFLSLTIFISACGRTGFRAGGGVVPEVCSDYPRVVDAPDQVGVLSSLAFDSYNIPHIAYYDQKNKQLKYAQAVTSQDQCGWDVAVVDDEGDITGQYPNLVIGEDNVPRIAYYSATQDAVQGAHYELRLASRIANNDGTFTWQKTAVDGTGFRGHFASMVLGPDNLYHLATLNSQTMDLEYAYYDGTNAAVFEPALNLSGKDVINLQVSIGVTPGAIPIIALHHPDGGLRILQRSAAPPSPGNWQVTMDPDQYYPVDNGLFVNLAVDSLGFPHLCYFRWDQSRSELWYSHFDGSAWQRNVVDSEDMTGANCSITLNASNLPLISYLNSTNNDLKVAFLRDPARMRWETWSVDYSLATGYASDIAVSGAGNIGISYYDFSIQGLKFYWIGIY